MSSPPLLPNSAAERTFPPSPPTVIPPAPFRHPVHPDSATRRATPFVPRRCHHFVWRTSRMSKVRILFLAANPDEFPPLLLGEEAREIRRRVRTAEHRDAVEFDLRWAVRPADLLEALSETRPQVLHFSGHARSHGIMLVSDDGRTAHPLDAEALVGLLWAFRADLRLVVLSSCWSLGHAQALTAIVDCAVGTRALISDEAAIAFNAAFYRAVVSGHSVQDAFDQGCAILKAGRYAEEELPELVVREGVDASQVVLVSSNGAGNGRPPAPRLMVSPTVFTVPPVAPEPDLVAVMMPFAHEFARTFDEVRAACDALGLRCERGDSRWEDSMVIQDVFNLIYRSAVVVADLSGRNPNVMYECGIAHTLGRPVIPITRDSQALPFDLAHHRALAYLPNGEGFAEMRAALEIRLRSLTGRAPE